jgi:5'(3')-deoxyribonucleotidase
VKEFAILPTAKQSEYFTRFVDIFFIIVVTLGVQHSISMFSNVLSGAIYPDFALLMLSFVAVGLSWVFYHLSVDDLPYLGVAQSWLRFLLDSAIAFSYTFLILSVDNLNTFGLVLGTIYFLYWVHGYSTIREHGWLILRDSIAQSSVPWFWFPFGIYFILVSGYLCISLPWLCPFQVTPGPLTDWAIVLMYWFGVALSRYLRHGKYTHKIVGGLRKLHLQHRPIIALDVDGVLADQVPHVLSRAEREMGTKMKKEQITAWDTAVGEIPFDRLILKYLQDSEFVMKMSPMEHARHAVDTIQRTCDIIVASSRPKETENYTVQWLRDNFGLDERQFKNTTKSGKSGLKADVLIDDNIGNIKSFVEASKHHLGILFSQPWNTQMDAIGKLIDGRRIVVKASWDEIRSMFAV